jgi:hypothetical protein
LLDSGVLDHDMAIVVLRVSLPVVDTGVEKAPPIPVTVLADNDAAQATIAKAVEGAVSCGGFGLVLVPVAVASGASTAYLSAPRSTT